MNFLNRHRQRIPLAESQRDAGLRRLDFIDCCVVTNKIKRETQDGRLAI